MPEVVFRSTLLDPVEVQLDGDVAVYVPQAGSVVVLSASAQAVYRLVDGRRPAGGIARELAAAYGVAPPQMLDDVLAVLHELRAAGLLSAESTGDAHVLRLRAMDSAFHVSVEDETVSEVLRELLSDLSDDGHPPTGPVHHVSVRGAGPWHVTALSSRETAASMEAVLTAVLAAINLSAVRTCPHMAMHAAVLARADRTLVLPGRSGLGKTTLTAALLQQGWEYVSDEALMLPWRGPLTPCAYPRPLALSDWAADVLGVRDGVAGVGERFVKPSVLRSLVRVDPAPVTDVVLMARGTATSPRLESLPRSAALVELFARGFTTPQAPDVALTRLGQLLDGAAVHALTTGMPAPTAHALALL